MENHDEDKKSYTCEECDAKFTREEHLLRHIEHNHAAEDPNIFACYNCQKSYRRKDTLLRHLRF